MADNLTRELIAAHLVDGEMTPGSEIALRIDQILFAGGSIPWERHQLDDADSAN